MTDALINFDGVFKIAHVRAFLPGNEITRRMLIVYYPKILPICSAFTERKFSEKSIYIYGLGENGYQQRSLLFDRENNGFATVIFWRKFCGVWKYNFTVLSIADFTVFETLILRWDTSCFNNKSLAIKMDNKLNICALLAIWLHTRRWKYFIGQNSLIDGSLVAIAMGCNYGSLKKIASVSAVCTN